MKTILFPTDFSDNAIHAAQYAAMLAKRYDARIILLNVYSVTMPIISEFQLANGDENMMVQRGKDAEYSLQVFSHTLCVNTNLASEQITQMVEYGLVSEVIIETANAMNVDLIVMATKGVSNSIDRWLGTNAENVMENAKCPVWIIPENAPLTLPLTIMYAADFKEDEVTATYQVLAMAQPLGATCKVIHVHEYFTDQKAEQNVTDLKDEFQNFDVSFKEINREEIAKGLVTYVRTHKPDVLAMAVYEKSFFSKIFNTSITQHFVQEAKIPMLFIRKETL
jgi:nucleotide-binding universal stress UspA family protein